MSGRETGIGKSELDSYNSPHFVEFITNLELNILLFTVLSIHSSAMYLHLLRVNIQ